MASGPGRSQRRKSPKPRRGRYKRRKFGPGKNPGSKANQWKPGQSGNPSGMSKDQAQARGEIIDILSQHGATFAKALVISAGKRLNPASIALGLAYLAGRPKQLFSLVGPDDGPAELKLQLESAVGDILLRLQKVLPPESFRLSMEELTRDAGGNPGGDPTTGEPSPARPPPVGGGGSDALDPPGEPGV